LVNNKTVIEAREEMLALTDPVSPKFVREFVLGTIHVPIPEDFLSRLVSESLKVPAHVWRDYYEGVVLKADDSARLGEIDAPTLILWVSWTPSCRAKNKSTVRQPSPTPR
jgi:hypothetical protein